MAPPAPNPSPTRLTLLDKRPRKFYVHPPSEMPGRSVPKEQVDRAAFDPVVSVDVLRCRELPILLIVSIIGAHIYIFRVYNDNACGAPTSKLLPLHPPSYAPCGYVEARWEPSPCAPRRICPSMCAVVLCPRSPKPHRLDRPGALLSQERPGGSDCPHPCSQEAGLTG